MDAETAYFLGSSCRWSRYEEQGIYYFNKAIELQLPNPKEIKKVYIQLAELYKVLHRFDEALACYQQAVEYDPSDNTIYYKIGQMYDRNLNQKKIAIEYYEKYLAGDITDHQLFDAEEGKSQTLRPYVEHRINELKEDLFFENQLP
jgi:tetratricopeptide (TPR) repeat protein